MNISMNIYPTGLLRRYTYPTPLANIFSRHLNDNLLRHVSRSFSRLSLTLHKMLNPLPGQPRIFRSKPPRDNSEDSNSAHDNRCIYTH